MSLWTSLRHFLDPTEQHAIRDNDYWGRWASGEERGPTAYSGIEVNNDNAQSLSVVWRCIDLLSGTLASLPSEVVRKEGERRVPVDRPPAWLDYPNPETNWAEYIERVMESLLLDGNAFVLITSRDSQGYPRELWTLHPRDVTVRKRNGNVEFVWEGQTVLSRYGPTNPAGDVLHIRLRSGGGLRGLSPIAYARQAIGLGLVGEKFGARFFGGGQQMSGVIQLPADQPAKSREHIELMRQTWEAAHAGSDKAHRPGILTGGATWQGISIPPEDAQFLQTRGFQVEDIGARFFGVPASLIGLGDKQSNWGTGVEAQALGLLRFTLLRHIGRIESAHTALVPRGQFHRLNQRGLLRADARTEGELLTQRLQNGTLSFNDFLAKYDEPARPGGDRYMIPANMELLEPNGEKKEKAPQLALPGEPTPSPNGNGRVTVPTGG
jgi:HK97 family phage portal protein